MVKTQIASSATSNVPIAVLAKQLAKVDANLSAQQIENLAQNMGLSLGSEGLREKQIEKAQKLLLTKLASSDYNNQQMQSAAAVMTPEQ